MNEFTLWFTTGLLHILDLSGYDHLLFVSLLALTVNPGEWKKLLVLVTAFTVGHCVTLCLSVNGLIAAPSRVIEFLIAFSILAGALYNLFTRAGSAPASKVIYMITLMFGLLHGLGFSYLLRSMLGEENVVLPLLYFNLGIEFGQLIIVACVALISLFLTAVVRIPFRYFKFSIVCIIALIAIKITSERLLLFFA